MIQDCHNKTVLKNKKKNKKKDKNEEEEEEEGVKKEDTEEKKEEEYEEEEKKEKSLFTIHLDFNLGKKVVKCYTWNMASYGVEI